MFYNEHQINSLLRCQNCSQKLDIPFTLPCGVTICSKCVLETKKKLNHDKFYNCFVCSSVHQMPNEGFNTCVLLGQLLSIKPIQFESNTQQSLEFSLGLTNEEIKNALELWS